MQQPHSASWRTYRCDDCDVIGRCGEDEPMLCWCCGGPATHSSGATVPDWAVARGEDVLNQAYA